MMMKIINYDDNDDDDNKQIYFRSNKEIRSGQMFFLFFFWNRIYDEIKQNRKIFESKQTLIKTSTTLLSKK